MTDIGVLIPVLNRPQNVLGTILSIEGSATLVPATPIFLVSPGDEAERAEIQKQKRKHLLKLEVVKWAPTRGDYPRKINHGFRTFRDEFEFFLFGADDLVFHPGWIEESLATFQRTHACVIGTNDMGNQRVIRGDHSTHPLVHRDYLDCGTADEDGKLYHEGYWHQYCDDEFVQTAKVRNTYAHAFDACIEHMHPDWGKGTRDETYRLAQMHAGEDHSLYRSRCPLWLS